MGAATVDTPGTGLRSAIMNAINENADTSEEEEEYHSLEMPERDDAVVLAAEGVLRKLHEGDPDARRPWTEAVPMAQADGLASASVADGPEGRTLKLVDGQLEADPTIFLWDNPDLMMHSASRNFDQLTLVGALDEEASGAIRQFDLHFGLVLADFQWENGRFEGEAREHGQRAPDETEEKYGHGDFPGG